MYIQIGSLKFFLQALEMFSWYLQHVHTEAGTTHCYTLRHDEAQDWRGGGYVTLGACAELHIHIWNTSPDRDVSYLEFVFSSITMDHPNLKPDK